MKFQRKPKLLIQFYKHKRLYDIIKTTEHFVDTDRRDITMYISFFPTNAFYSTSKYIMEVLVITRRENGMIEYNSVHFEVKRNTKHPKHKDWRILISHNPQDLPRNLSFDIEKYFEKYYDEERVKRQILLDHGL